MHEGFLASRLCADIVEVLLVQRPFFSSSSTIAAISHMLKIVASSRDRMSRVGRSVLMDCAQQLRVLVASFVDWSKRVSVLRHTLPKLKSLPIYADSAHDVAVHMRLEMATPHLAINRLNAESNRTFEFTPLCV